MGGSHTRFLQQRRAKVLACQRPWRLLTIPERAFCHFGDCYYVYDKMSEKYKTAQEKICAMRYSRRLQHGKYDKKPADGSFAWDDYYA